MLHPIVLCFLFLAYHVRSEVSQESPVEQTIKSLGSNDSRIEALEKMARDYENLTIEIFNAPKINPNDDYLMDMCYANNKSESYPAALEAVKKVKKCFADVVSYAELPAKIKKSKPYGELDTVFKEYCQKTDVIQGCIHVFVRKITPCMNFREIHTRYTVEKITESVLKFVCENEGDHIALFISEKGPDCILSKQEGIKKCVKDTHSRENKENPSTWPGYTDLYFGKFNFTSEKEVQFVNEVDLARCRSFYKMRRCIVNELQTCSGSTPANVVDSIFNLIHNETECSRYAMKDIDPEYSSGTSLFTSFFSVVLPALTILLVRTFNS